MGLSQRTYLGEKFKVSLVLREAEKITAFMYAHALTYYEYAVPRAVLIDLGERSKIDRHPFFTTAAFAPQCFS